MVQRFESVRISSEIDATKHVAGAQAIVDANKKIVESGKAVETQATSTERKIGETATGYDRLVRRLDPAAKASHEMSRATENLNRWLERGVIDAQQHAAALKLVGDRYKPSTDAAVAHTGAVKLQAYQITNLGQQLQDVAVQLQGGANPFTILMQQGPQITSAMGGVRNAIALIGPSTIGVVAGVAALAVGFGLVASRAFSLQAEAREAGVSLRAMGRDATMAATDVSRLIEAQTAQGVSRADARGAVGGALRVSRASAGDISRASSLAPDFAAGYGMSIADATKQLTEMGAQGLPAIEKLQAATGALTTEQLAQVRALARVGDQAGAAAIAYGALEARTKGLAKDALSPLDQALHKLGQTWNSLVNDLAKGAVGTITVNVVNGTVDAVGGFSSKANPGGSGIMGFIQRLVNPLALFADTYAPAGAAAGGSGGGSGGGGSGAPPAGADGGGGGDNFSADFVTKATEAYERQGRVLAASIGIRDQVRARIEAENEVARDGIQGASATALITLRVNEAKRAQLSAFNDNLAALEQETDGQMKLADAYGQSLAAGTAMEAQVRALGEKFRNDAVDVAKLTAAYQANAAAQGLSQARRSVDDVKQQALGAERLAVAARNGAQASQEAARQNEVETFKRQALSTATDATRTKIEAEIVAYDKATKSRLGFNQQLERDARLRAASNDNSLARADLAAASTLGGGRREAELEVDRLRKRQELTGTYGSMSDPNAAREYGLYIDTQKIQEQAQQARASYDFVANAGERAFDRVGDAMTQMAVEGGDAFASLRNVASGIVASIYSDFLKLAVANPLKNMLLGGNAPTLSSVGGLLGSIFGGGNSTANYFGGATPGSAALPFGGPRAAGGPVEPGKAYLVGENGPEPFVPSTRGTILPTGSLGGANIKVIVNDNRSSKDAAPVEMQTSRGPNGDVVLEAWINDKIDARMKQNVASGANDKQMGIAYGISRKPFVRS